MTAGRLVRVLTTVLLAAGAVGIARQHLELRAVRAGHAPPVTAGTVTAPPAREGPLSRALAGWVPDRPSTRAGRVAAALWTAPGSLVGGLLGASTRGRPRWDHEHGCWVFEGGTGGPVRLLRSLGMSANAVGQVVISAHEQTPPLLLAHEAAHVRQAERLGPVLLPVYVWYWARHGYRDHPVERAARTAARRWAARQGEQEG